MSDQFLDDETLASLYGRLASKDEEIERLGRSLSSMHERHLAEEAKLRLRIVQLEAERDAAALHPSHDDVMLTLSHAIRTYNWADLAEQAEGTDFEDPLKRIARVEAAFWAARKEKP